MNKPIRMAPTRRVFTRSLLTGAGLFALPSGFLAAVLADEMVEEIRNLKPGDYTWHPERSPAGPVAIIVTLPDQLCHVYRNGIRVAVSTVSSGKSGYETPTGVFTILEKAKVHHSSKYNEASMPNTERLTWSGVALHAGGLPGYPSSHGCIHLPLKFSAELFTITQIGTPVIVAGSHNDPVAVVHPGLILDQYAASEFDEAVSAEKKPPDDASIQHTSIVVSGADKRIDILVNGDVFAQGTATIDDPATPLGENVFVLSAADNDAKTLTWHAVSFNRSGTTPPDDDPGAVIRRIHGDRNVVEAIKLRMLPGTVLVTTDLPTTPDSKTGKDFVIVDTVEN